MNDIQEPDEADAWGSIQEQIVKKKKARVARMPVERYASEYNMSHPKRGLAIIFNHEVFEIASLKPRSGTNVDAENLRKALTLMHFDVKIYQDLRMNDVIECINQASEMDHTDKDCILIAILSHGERDCIYARDSIYKLEYIWSRFKADECPSLAGKPKLFFIQACQGDTLDQGIAMVGRTETDGDCTLSYKLPVCADFLMAYSTVPGYYSWRNTTKGSWFMQCLCNEIARNGKKYDLLTLLTFVNQRVAVDFESNSPDQSIMHKQKQVPFVSMTLTRIVRFNDK